MLFYISFILVLSASSLDAGFPVKEKVALEPTLDNVLISLKKVMVFFSKRFDKMNVDALFGIRLVQSELQRALEKGEAGIYPMVRDNQIVRDQIKEILKIADETAERALPEVKKKDEAYFNTFFAVIDKPWRMYELEPIKLTKYNEEDLPPPAESAKTEQKDFNEINSDNCMSTLLGEDHEKCDVKTCWETMTALGTESYYTTHQVLWFQLGMKEGCQQQFEERLPEIGGLDKILTKLCSNIIFQMHALFKDGTVNHGFQDLFLEQGAVCGAAGFVDAVNMTWLESVLKWQHPEFGCFRELMGGHERKEGEKLLRNLEQEKKEEWKSRKLLADMSMGDHCSAHRTGVGAGFLSVYLRLFLDPEYVRHQLWPALYGEGYDPYIWRKRFKYLALFCLVFCFIIYAIGRRRRYKILQVVGGLKKEKKSTSYL